MGKGETFKVKKRSIWNLKEKKNFSMLFKRNLKLHPFNLKFRKNKYKKLFPKMCMYLSRRYHLFRRKVIDFL